LVTTSYVFDEVVTFFNSRGQHAKALQVGNNLLQSPSVQFIHVDTALFYEGWAYFQRHQDKDYSLTDCISFLVMQKLGIRRAFASISILSKRALPKSRSAESPWHGRILMRTPVVKGQKYPHEWLFAFFPPGGCQHCWPSVTCSDLISQAGACAWLHHTLLEVRSPSS